MTNSLIKIESEKPSLNETKAADIRLDNSHETKEGSQCEKKLPENSKAIPTDSKTISDDAKSVIEVKNLRKVYLVGKQPVFALNTVSFQVQEGEFCCIVGTSGSGKSTLLNLMAGLEPPSKGEIIIRQKNITKFTEKQLVEFRRQHVGFIFQSFNLIPSMNAWENVALPLIFKGMSASSRKKLAISMLKKMGLKTHIMHKPNELSGGQQQRVGIARALVVNPDIVFADEPTGNLDSATSAEIMQLLQEISRENHQTLILVTHDNQIAQFADRIFRISDGKIIGIEKGQNRNEPVNLEA